MRSSGLRGIEQRRDGVGPAAQGLHFSSSSAGSSGWLAVAGRFLISSTRSATPACRAARHDRESVERSGEALIRIKGRSENRSPGPGEIPDLGDSPSQLRECSAGMLGDIPGQQGEPRVQARGFPELLAGFRDARLDLVDLVLDEEDADQAEQQQHERPQQEQRHLGEVPEGEGAGREAEGESQEDADRNEQDGGKDRREEVEDGIGEDQKIGDEEDHEQRHDQADRPDRQ